MSSSSSKFRGQTEKLWRRLFHATDFQSLMYPNFTFCRILGIFPYKVNASTFETSKLSNIMRTFVFGAFCVYEVIILHKTIVNKTVNYKDVTNALQVACYYMFGGFVAIITYVLSDPRMHALQAVLKTSSRLSPEAYRKLSRWIHIKDILGTFFLAIESSIYYFKYTDDLQYYVLGIYIDVLIFQADMMYMNCVCVLKSCFKAINDSLARLQSVLMNDVQDGPRLVREVRKTQLLLIELKTLKKQHLLISGTAQTLNVIFSLQLLVTVTLTFTDVTFELYSHLIRWQDGLSFVFPYDVYDIYFSPYVGYLIVKLILIVWACETGKNQAFEIGTTVHDALNCASDKQIKEELHLFSLQVLHCARNSFTTRGLIIDATLLAAMTGSIATYILILTQFMILSHSCDSKTASLPK